MGKTSKQSLKDTANTSTNPTNKVKRTRKTVPRDSPPQRSSIYRGVTRLYNHILWFIFFLLGDFLFLGFISVHVLFRHRWTGRYEAHLWDKNSWNESQNKKGRQGSSSSSSHQSHFIFLSKSFTVILTSHFIFLVLFFALTSMVWCWWNSTVYSVSRCVYKSSLLYFNIYQIFFLSCNFPNITSKKKWKIIFFYHLIYGIFSLGAYDDEEAAAHAYDLAALKYWGQDTILNFPVHFHDSKLFCSWNFLFHCLLVFTFLYFFFN
jgi:AP2-like factor (ANT lineage)